MAKNQELEKHVLTAMYSYLISNDSGFKFMCEGEEETGKAIIQSLGEVRVDESSKIRMHYGKLNGYELIGYGYDFEGNHAKETYERAVKNTRESVLGDLGETLLSDNVVDEKYGLYLTSI